MNEDVENVLMVAIARAGLTVTYRSEHNGEHRAPGIWVSNPGYTYRSRRIVLQDSTALVYWDGYNEPGAKVCLGDPDAIRQLLAIVT